MSAATLQPLPWVTLALAVAACSANPSERPSDDTSAPPARSMPAATSPAPGAVGPTSNRAPVGKPSAPVTVSLTTHRLGGGDHEITLTARPTRDVPSLELMLDGQREQLGAVRAGEEHTLTVRVSLADEGGRDVVAGAATGTGNHRRSRAATTRIGAPAVVEPPLPVRIITLSDGTELAEVRP